MDKPLTLAPHELAAALAGTLRQVRRPVVYIPALGEAWNWCSRAAGDDYGFVHIIGDYRRFSPLGQPGDVIWGRETWALIRPWIDMESGYAEDLEDWTGKLPTERPCNGWQVLYSADHGPCGETREERGFKWRSPITMPRWASRWARTVRAVRVERIGSMTLADVVACGYGDMMEYVLDWDDRYGKKYPSNDNPWVWVADLDSKGEQQ